MTVSAASHAVQKALAAKRIGTPVSVRLVDHSAADAAQIEPALARDLETAAAWLGAEVRRLAALGDLQSGPVSVLLEFVQGQTALVSVGTRGRGAPLVEALVVGGRGVLSWEPGRGPTSGPQPGEERASAAGHRLLAAVRRSLALGSPVALSAEARAAETPAGASRPRPEPRQAEKPMRPSPAEPPFGVLLVAGAHTHQENYAADFAADPRCRLIAVTDEPGVSARRRDLNAELARKLAVPVLEDLAQALSRDDVHVVSVCAEPERRAAMMVRCAEAGKHLYLDKPMAASADEADAVVRAVRAAGVASQMFSTVHWPVSTRMREAIRSGRLGAIRSLHFDLTFAKGQSGTTPIDRPRVERARPTQFERIDSKREMYNVGVYSLVQLGWLLGRRVGRVYAATGNYFFAEHRRNDMEDFAVVLAELDGGVTATLACGRTGWRSHPMGGLNRVCLVGADAVASVDAYRPRLAVWADENPWLPPKVDPQDPMGFWKSTFEGVEGAPKQAWITPGSDRSDASHFVDCLERGRPSEVPAEAAAEVVKVLMAAYRSAATGQFAVPAP